MVRHYNQYTKAPKPDRCGSVNELGQRCHLDQGHRDHVGSNHKAVIGDQIIQWDEYGIFDRDAYIGVGVTEAQAKRDIAADRFDDGRYDR